MPPEKQIHPLDPVWDDHCRVLVLGSFPSPRSREVGFYYGHGQNRFWPVLSALYQQEVPTAPLLRKEFLLSHHIALWDVVGSCTISGAADSSIQHVVPNPVEDILRQAPIEQVFTTGAKAFSLYESLCYPKTGVHAYRLPSTSAANRARFDLEKLLEAYRVLLSYTEN